MEAWMGKGNLILRKIVFTGLDLDKSINSYVICLK